MEGEIFSRPEGRGRDTHQPPEADALQLGGITVCGENRVQELTAHLADDAYRGASVHFIATFPS